MKITIKNENGKVLKKTLVLGLASCRAFDRAGARKLEYINGIAAPIINHLAAFPATHGSYVVIDYDNNIHVLREEFVPAWFTPNNNLNSLEIDDIEEFKPISEMSVDELSEFTDGGLNIDNDGLMTLWTPYGTFDCNKDDYLVRLVNNDKSGNRIKCSVLPINRKIAALCRIACY